MNGFEGSKGSNGRINMEHPNTASLFAMYDRIPVNQCATMRNPTEGQFDENALSKAYFAKENITVIQNGLRKGVYVKSNGQYTIGLQDCDTLKVIMRSVFLQHAANLPDHINDQVEQLNAIVLDYSVEQVFSEAVGYFKYLRDASTMYVPMAPPIMSNMKDKQLGLKPWF